MGSELSMGDDHRANAVFRINEQALGTTSFVSNNKYKPQRREIRGQTF